MHPLFNACAALESTLENSCAAILVFVLKNSCGDHHQRNPYQLGVLAVAALDQSRLDDDEIDLLFLFLFPP